jgi:hypothetical protein
MPKTDKQEILAAIAAYIKDTDEPYSVLAVRLNISVSTVRRAAAAFGITRRKRIDESVLARIDRAREEESK